MKEKNYKKCVICDKEYPCTPSRNVVTCSRECRLKYLSQNHKGLKMSAATREKMAESRKKVPNSAEIQRMATEAAKKSPKSGRFITNKAAIDWHLVSPEGEHFHIHSLAFWLRENHEMFGVEPDTREFKNVISGLSRVKRAMLGKIGDGQRPCATYKGWSVIPTDYDLEKLNSKRVVVNGSSTQICLERYKTAIVFGTVNTVSQSLILISRNYKDQIDIKSLCGASETSITGNVNLETGNVTLNFSGNNSAIIIW